MASKSKGIDERLRIFGGENTSMLRNMQAQSKTIMLLNPDKDHNLSVCLVHQGAIRMEDFQVKIIALLLTLR